MHDRAASLFCPNPPDILYHYCSAEVLMSIITKQHIWLTDFSKMNDYEEELWAAKQIYRTHVALSKQEDSSQLFREYYHREYESNRISLRKFLCCFSEDGDLLSQWRAYAANGTGFAIGFYVNKLDALTEIPVPSSPAEKVKYLIKISYNQEDQAQFINASLEHDRKVQEPVRFSTAGLLAHSSIAMKNVAFKEEKEWRIVYSPIYIENNFCGETNSVYFRTSNRGIVPYLTHHIEFDAIAKVIIGPANQTREDDLSLFLENYLFKDVEVSKSSASYRG